MGVLLVFVCAAVGKAALMVKGSRFTVIIEDDEAVGLDSFWHMCYLLVCRNTNQAGIVLEHRLCGECRSREFYNRRAFL